MSLYEVLKASRAQRFPDYFTLLWGRKLSAKMIKTLTGTLPLTFSTSEDKLRDWTIYGNNNVGKNLLEITAETQTVSGVKFTIDTQDGTVIADGSPSVTSAITCELGAINFTPGNYILSGCSAGGGSSNYRLDLRINQNTLYANTVDNGSGASFQVTENITLYVYARLYGAYGTFNEVLFEPMVRLSDTSATFESYQIGVGQRTKNLLEITATSGVYTNAGANLTYTIDKTANTITLNGTSRTDNDYFVISFSYFTVYGDYIISGGSEYSTYRIWDSTANAYTRKTDNSSVAESFGGDSTVRLPKNHSFSHRIRVAPQKTFDNVILHLMLRAADTDAEFIPRGYEIPLSVNGTPQDIYIGDSPLTGSDTATKVSTGVDIATTDGTNTISTTLYNKPEMLVAYGYKGAGVHVGNGWEFNFITSANGNQQLTKITMDTPLRAGETLTSEQAGVTIPTYAGAENTLSLYPSASGYGNPEMTITYKGG